MSGEALQLEMVTTGEALDAALAVRRRVFIEEQGVLEAEEIDAHDVVPSEPAGAVHVLARFDGREVGTGRLLLDYPKGERAHIGRVAVLPDQRGYGIGRAVMRWLEDEAGRHGYSGITLAAQLHAIPFYERLGYTARDEVFLDAGIEHRWMDLDFEVGPVG